MYRIAIYIILTLKATDSWITEKESYYVPKASAATASQIRFAEENKYDDTGPGAKEPQAAYKTFKTLEEALVAYLDDPDTKLPEAEAIKAYKKLLSQKDYNPYLKHQTQAILLTKYQHNHPNKYYTSKIASVFPALENKYSSPFRKIGDVNLKLGDQPRPFKSQEVKDVSPAYAEDENPEDDPNPEYAYSYGVHDQKTGDSKAAQEARTGGVVSGWYSFLQADGRRRTVHYQADDKQGFRATVHQDKA